MFNNSPLLFFVLWNGKSYTSYLYFLCWAYLRSHRMQGHRSSCADCSETPLCILLEANGSCCSYWREFFRFCEGLLKLFCEHSTNISQLISFTLRYYFSLDDAFRVEFCQRLKMFTPISINCRFTAAFVLVVSFSQIVCVIFQGAPETIQSRLTEVPSYYVETYKKFTRQGSRVLALAYKSIGDMTVRSLLDVIFCLCIDSHLYWVSTVLSFAINESCMKAVYLTWWVHV